METAADLLRGKTGKVATLPLTATVSQAVQLMSARQIGSVLVTDDDQLIGIFTERDLLTRIVAAERHPSVTNLSEVMTSPVVCAAPQTTTDELRAFMRERRIRHAPVVDEDNQVLGVLSMSNLIPAGRPVQIRTIREVDRHSHQR
jgi:CBS domain-containing protein